MVDYHKHGSTEQQRVIRVFISSTFRDMHAERDELVKRAFPKLRKLCESRGVTWGEVDLRWGIPDEEKAEGKVLPICLAEIKRCRPYFIGLLGERYGWVPDEIPRELIHREPWLREHLSHSVTELEILHGVLRNPEMAEHAFFYFRDPSYLEHLPADANRSDFASEDEVSKEKLHKLKRNIKDSGFPVRENYSDPQALGALVLKDMTAVIDRLYPEGLQPDPLVRDAVDHEAFARSRAGVEVRPGEFTGVYIGRDKYLKRLDDHVQRNGPPLVILGESGSGKSALISNWALTYRQKHPEEFLLMHFIGASPYSADWTAMLRRIMSEFKSRFDIQQEIPDKPDELRAAFANYLHMASARGRMILILDALNQLEDRDGAPDLVWLPPVIPDNIRLILSTLPGRPLEELKKRSWPTLTVELLTKDERSLFIEKYLFQYSRKLDAHQAGRIAASEQGSNPLFLQSLLEELRFFGYYEHLDEHISHYLEAETIPDLYGKILARYEKDYERDRPGLVGDAMKLLWSARRGLTESELLDILGSNGAPLPQAAWSPLYLVAERSLVNRSGLIGFSHDYLREAVKIRYLPQEQDRKDSHLRIADYFHSHELGPRKIDEFPWQLSQANDWEKLYELLSDLQFFDAAWSADQFEVKGYWATLEANSLLRMVDAYRFESKAEISIFAYVLQNIATLLFETGHPKEALFLRNDLLDHYQRIGDLKNLEPNIGHKGLIMKDTGNLNKAMELFKEQEKLCREIGLKDGLAICLGNQGLIMKDTGNFNKAMELFKEQEKLCRETGNRYGLLVSLSNQPSVFLAQGDIDRALVGYKEQERLSRELGDQYALSSSLGNQAVGLQCKGDVDAAMILFKKQEEVCVQTGNKAHLIGSLNNQGGIHYTRGELDNALALWKETERLSRDLEDKAGLATCLKNQATMLRTRGNLDGAMALLQQAEQIFRDLVHKCGLSQTLGSKAHVLSSWGRLDEAMERFKEQEKLCREIGLKGDLAICLGNQGLILKDTGNLNEAMELLKEQERICRELSIKEGLQTSLCGQALILRRWGKLDEAMELLKEQETICRELNIKEGLQTSLGNQALILQDWGKLDEAMELHKEVERIYRELSNKDGLQTSLVCQAVILQAWGRLEEAMGLYEEVERICRELSNKDGLSRALGTKANVLYAWGRLEEAMELLKEQERICREISNKNGLAISLFNQSKIMANMSRVHEALSLAEEAYRIATDYGLTALAQQIKPILDAVRSKSE